MPSTTNTLRGQRQSNPAGADGKFQHWPSPSDLRQERNRLVLITAEIIIVS